MRKEKKEGAIRVPVNKKESLFLPPLGSSWDLTGVGMGKERLVRDECVTTVVRPWRKSRKTRKENREHSSRMEAHEVAPDVVDVAPADVIKVSFTQIVHWGKNLNWLSASERQNSAAKQRLQKTQKNKRRFIVHAILLYFIGVLGCKIYVGWRSNAVLRQQIYGSVEYYM